MSHHYDRLVSMVVDIITAAEKASDKSFRHDLISGAEDFLGPLETMTISRKDDNNQRVLEEIKTRLDAVKRAESS